MQTNFLAPNPYFSLHCPFPLYLLHGLVWKKKFDLIKPLRAFPPAPSDLFVISIRYLQPRFIRFKFFKNLYCCLFYSHLLSVMIKIVDATRTQQLNASMKAKYRTARQTNIIKYRVTWYLLF